MKHSLKWPLHQFLFLALLTLSVSNLYSKRHKPTPIAVQATRPNDSAPPPYQADSINAAYQVVLPVGLQRAKELIADSAAPLGFRLPKKMKDKLKAISRSTDRSIRLDKGMQAQLMLEFEELSTGDAPSTQITVETASLELIGKKRDHSVAGTIVAHAIHLHYLFTDLRSTSSHKAIEKTEAIPSNLKIPLYLRRFINARSVKKGDLIEFAVKQDVIVGVHLAIRKGASAWGKVTDAKEARFFGIKGKLSIVISQIETANGEMIHVEAKAKEMEESIDGQRRFPKGFVPPVLYLLAAGGQPKLMAGSTHWVHTL